jgi:hypothetical protein
MLLWARERHHGLGDEAYVVDGVTGLGLGRWMRVRASTMVGNDGAEALGWTRRGHKGSEEDLTMARAPGRSTTARTPGNF